jgi:hypothetical protein
METKNTLNCWAVVELMGHQRIAGQVTEQSVAGVQMLKVDVPAVGEVPAYTRFLGGGAIYAINPVDEETCIGWVKSIAGNASPIVSWDGKQIIDKLVEKRLAALPSGTSKRKECELCYRTLSEEEENEGANVCESCAIAAGETAAMGDDDDDTNDN